MLPVAAHIPTGAFGAPSPLPLIVVVHGRDGDPRSLRPLLDPWTAAGYVRDSDGRASMVYKIA